MIGTSACMIAARRSDGLLTDEQQPVPGDQKEPAGGDRCDVVPTGRPPGVGRHDRVSDEKDGGDVVPEGREQKRREVFEPHGDGRKR